MSNTGTPPSTSKRVRRPSSRTWGLDVTRPRPSGDGDSRASRPISEEIKNKRTVIKHIKGVLRSFRLKDLISNMMLELFKVELENLKDKLTELKLRATKASVVALLDCRLKAFNVAELQDMMYTLLLYRAAFGGKQKKWVAMKLLEPVGDVAEAVSFSADEKLIKLNILQSLRIKGRDAVVKIMTYEELIWVMIIVKKLVRRTGIHPAKLKLMTPVVICYEVGLPYIFTASKMNKVIMESVLRALYFSKHQRTNVEGKDIKSLLTLLKVRKSIGDNLLNPLNPQNVANQARAGARWTDLSQRPAREAYANQLFNSKNPNKLETLTVVADTKWTGALVPGMKGEPFKVTMKLKPKSKDVVQMVKDMVINKAVTTPLPEYLRTLTQLPRSNTVYMQTEDSEESE